MALNPIATFGVLHLVGLNSGGSPVAVLLSTEWGSSRSTDTPASEPYFYVLRPQSFISWTAVDTSKDWPDIGGIERHPVYEFFADSERNPITETSPLDFLGELNFTGQEAILYMSTPVHDATVGWQVPSLANSTKVMRGTVLTDRTEGDVFSIKIQEQTTNALQVISSPQEWKGLGSGVRVEEGGSAGSGPRVVRFDDAALRTQGSQWMAWTLIQNGTHSVSQDSIFISPIIRLRHGNATVTDGLTLEMLNLAGTWQRIGPDPLTVTGPFDLRGILVNYNLSDTTADVYVNGSLAGSTVLTSGINAAPGSVDIQFFNSGGTREMTWFFFRAGNRFLPDSDILDRNVFGIPLAEDLSITAAIDFGDYLGDESLDTAGGESALLVGFADADASWTPSHEGPGGAAHTRPRVNVGRPLGAQIELADVGFQHITSGIDATVEPTGPALLPARGVRHVLANGRRLKPEIDALSSLSVFGPAAPGKKITGIPMEHEPAVAQELDFDTAPNAATHVVRDLIVDPLLGIDNLSTDRGSIIVESSVVASSTVGIWTSVALDHEWTDAPIANNKTKQRYPLAEVVSGLTENTALSTQRFTNDGIHRLAEVYLLHLGPVVDDSGVVTKEKIRSISLEFFGWQGEGGDQAIEHAARLAKATPSEDDGPSVIFRDGDGDWFLRGSDLSPTVADFTFPERRIENVEDTRNPVAFDAIKVLYGKYWAFDEASRLAPQANRLGRLENQTARQWREAQAEGSGSKEVPIETYFLRLEDARPFANGMLSILNGDIRTIKLLSPIKESETAMKAFHVIDITWAADPLLSSGKKGILLKFTLNEQSAKIGAEMVVLFI